MASDSDITVVPQTALLSNVLYIASYAYLSQSGTVSALFEVGLIIYVRKDQVSPLFDIKIECIPCNSKGKICV